MTLVQEYSPGQFSVWTGGKLPNGISAPSVIENLWSDAQLAAVGLYRPVPFVAPEGKVATGSPSYARVGQQIIETYAVMDTPLPSANVVRVQTYVDDADANTGAQQLIAQLDTASLAAIETWIRSKLNADAVVDLATAKTFCKRTETAFVQLMKALVIMRGPR